MTVIHSRPQESPLFQKFSFFCKMQGICLGNCIAEWVGVSQLSGNRCQVRSREGKIWSEETALALVFTLGVCSTAHMRCKQDCLLLPPCWEANIYVINLGVGAGRGGGWNGCIFRYPGLFPKSRLEKVVLVWTLAHFHQVQVCICYLALVECEKWIWASMSRMTIMNVISRVGRGKWVVKYIYIFCTEGINRGSV